MYAQWCRSLQHNGTTGAGCHFFFQGIFPTQGSNLHLLHWQAGSLLAETLGKPHKPVIKKQPEIFSTFL